MTGHYFISYSTVEATEFATKLYDALVGGYPHVSAWLDQRSIQPQMDWEVALEQAIADCIGFLYVMTGDSVHPSSTCRQELGLALTFKKPVIPIKLHTGCTPPLRMQNRQHIDFSTDFEAGMANLRQHLAWLETPEGKVYVLECRLRDVERELPRTADPSQKARLDAEMRRLTEEITQKRNIAADPEAARQRTSESIKLNLERERMPEGIVREVRAKFINPPPGIAPSYFQDRHVETKQLGQWLGDPQTRLVSVVGRGGVGKTAMVCRLLKALEAGHLPDDGDDLDVDGIVYLSAISSHRPDVPNLFANLGKLLPGETAQELDALYRDVQASPTEKMQTLLSYFPSTKRIIVLLDNFEDVMDSSSEDGRIADAELNEALQTLLQAPAHGLKVVITTRVAPMAMLKDARPGTYRTLPLDKGLESPFAENILREMDSTGRLGLHDAPDEVLSRVRERTRGYPRALEALVAILESDPDSRLDDILNSAQSALPQDLVKVIVGEAFNRLDRSAQQVMQALAIFRRPVPPVALDYVLQTFQPGIDSAPILSRLASMHFVRRESGRYYLHPVDRDYAISRVVPGETSDRFEAGDPVFTRVALRDLGARYLASIRKPRANWQTLLDLQPLIDEIEMRCENGDWDTAAEVLDDISEQYLQVWGYYRLELELRQRLEERLTDNWQQYLNQYNMGYIYSSLGSSETGLVYLERARTLARDQHNQHEECRTVAVMGYCYSALGQEERALAYFEEAFALAREAGAENLERALYSVLGNAYQNLGRHQQAVEYLEQALTLAEQARDQDWQVDALQNLGGCYRSLGQYRRALEYYERALALTHNLQAFNRQFWTMQGIGHCYVALGETERAIEFYEKCVDMAHNVDDPRREGMALENLADCLAKLQHTEQALTAYQQAVALAHRSGSFRDECRALRLLASHYCYTDRYVEATHTVEEALQLARHAADAREEAISLADLGWVNVRAGRITEGIATYERALTLFRSIDDKPQQAATLSYIGDRFAEIEDLERTFDYYEQALALYREMANHRQESVTLGYLAYYAVDQGDITRAISYYEQALEIERRLDDRKEQAISFSNLGACMQRIGKLKQAQDYFESALEITRQTGDRVEEARKLNRLGNFCRTVGKVTQAVEYYQMALTIARQATVPDEESYSYRGLAECRLDQGNVAGAIQACEKGLAALADLSVHLDAAYYTHQALARARLAAGDIAGTLAALKAARELNRPDVDGYFSKTFGIILLRQGEQVEAEKAFLKAVTVSESRLAYTPELYGDLYTRGLALCGLALCGQQERLPDAIDSFRKARAVAPVPGAALASIRLMDALVASDHDGILAEARRALAGE